MRTCKTCGETKSDDEFEQVWLKGKPHRRGSCRECVKQIRRDKYHVNREKHSEQSKRHWREKGRETWKKKYAEQGDLIKARAKKYRDRPKGRATAMCAQAYLRDKERCNLDRNEIEKILQDGRCQRTGIHFDFTTQQGRKVNKFSPSLDRKDKNQGYTKENTQVVVWCYNTGKGEMTDKEFVDFCREVVAYNA
jgi:hypothetical protein